MSKPVEYLMHEQIWKYINTNNLINGNQYGFVHKSSTAAACVKFVDNIQKARDKGKIVCCLAIDISKAFDSINHQILLYKLNKIGFSENALKLTESYLSQRSQYIEFDGKQGEREIVRSGVPQGSILGPTYFNICINDVFELDLKGKMIMYADDAILTYQAEEIPSIEAMMKEDIIILAEYFQNNNLKINIKKSQYIILGDNSYLNLQIDNEELKQVQEMNYLGLLINQKFNWSNHCHSIIKKISPFIYIFYRLQKVLTKDWLFNIYFAQVNSRLTYLNCIWSGTNEYIIHKIKVIQNKCIKNICRLPRLSTSKLLYNPKILPIDIINKYESALLIYKIKNKLMKTDINLVVANQIHEYETRNNNVLRMERVNTTRFGLNGVLYRGLLEYNNLEQTLKNTNNLKEFKSHLKRQLLTQNNYNNW